MKYFLTGLLKKCLHKVKELISNLFVSNNELGQFVLSVYKSFDFDKD